MDLARLIDQALDARAGLLERLHAEGTDAYRLFQGVAEGREGLTIDRYGPLVLVQTFREPLEPAEWSALEGRLRARLPLAREIAYRPRGRRGEAGLEDGAEHVCSEMGVRFLVRARHRGQDPWLFLDLRAGRRRLKELAAGRTVLNLFAYTCTAGISAVASDAREVWNVDFSAGALAVGRRNAEANDVAPARIRFVQEDCLPVVRQLAGLPMKGRGSARPYLRFEPRRFDLVFLDPPAWAKSPFGAVDVERDYESLFKPAVLCATEGGIVLATNHSPRVELEAWLETLRRCAAKAGRPLASIEAIAPEADFPSTDGRPPLKIALCEVGSAAQ